MCCRQGDCAQGYFECYGFYGVRVVGESFENTL